jgi:hypothetical protein
MNRLGTLQRTVTAVALLALTVPSLPVAAQADARLTVGKIKDGRHRPASGDPTGELLIFPSWEGKEVEAAKGFQLTVTSARDETGKPLMDQPWTTAWETMRGSPNLWIRLLSPERGASTVTVTGSIALYVPGRDPEADVKVPDALARPGKAYVSKGLKDEKIDVYLASRDQLSESSIVLYGLADQMARVGAVRVLRPDGTELGIASTSTGSSGEEKVIEIGFSESIPKGASIVFSLRTGKSVLTVPFEFRDVPLP